MGDLETVMIAAVDARKSILGSILEVLSFVGCAPTLAEIRGLEPVRAEAFPGDYRKVARCTLDELDARTTWQAFWGPPSRNQLVERDGHVDVTGYVPQSGVPTFEIRSRPAADNRTAVELRHTRWHGVQNDTLWPAVEKCGGKG